MEMKKLHFVIVSLLVAICVVDADNDEPLLVDDDHNLLTNLEEGQHLEETRNKRAVPSSSQERPTSFRSCQYFMPFFSTPQCCERGFTYIDLRKNAPCDKVNTAEGVEIIQQTPAQTSVVGDCNRRALLKVNFEKFTITPCDYCLRGPLCGRRMLKIDLELGSGTRKGWGFNIGDSRTNDGYKGDYNTQKNDAELEGVFPSVRLYHSDRCNTRGAFKTFPTAIGPNVKHVTIYISNQHVRIVNDQGLDEYVCDNCLYALNGQADIQGRNEEIYIGLNRVITGRADRNGQGICSATLTWVCPRW